MQANRKSAKQLPKTFAQRGVSIAFSTPALRYTRLRITRSDAWEALLPGLSGGLGTYVIPWHSMPEMISLSLHDRALFDLLKTREDTVPAGLRRHLLSVQADGYDGPDKSVSAQQAMDEDKAVERYLHSNLLAQAVRHFGHERSFTAEELAGPDMMQAAVGALDECAERTGISGEEAAGFLSEWALLALPVGSSDGESIGYLFHQLQDMAAFTAELQEWAADEMANTAAMAGQLAEAASMAGRLAMETAEKIHLLEGNLRASLKNWTETRKMIHKLVSRTSWLLDGWPRLVEQWEESREAPRYRQRELVAELVQNLPVLPEEALNPDQAIIWSNYRLRQENWASLSIHGESHEVDQDVKDMLGAFPMEEV